ncbi:hypothetical protein HHI36_016381 [Cryptolaemus montrouzieri]|uniref:Peptidase S1 domain-containing protein n=1 Tax=Cryptolaemus montrouzieri TaxID=559131 RepID=A0ABD2NJZ2_9CUCU
MWMKLLLVILCYNFSTTTDTRCGSPIGYQSPSSDREDRIVGGYDMGYYKYPWYVALVRDKIVGCGGSLINAKTVLTAAHCFKSTDKTKLEEYYTIKLGVYNICTSESTQTTFKAEKVKIHELYFKKNPYYDIALVTLTTEASQFVPICLPTRPITKRPKEGLVPGLGVLKYEGATPCTLHESRLLISSDKECKSMLVNVEKNVSHIIKAFCAGYIQGGVDTCQGDSGGPFQIIGTDGKYTLLGVVSFGYKCASPGVLGLYTDVSQYLDWIKKHATGSLPVGDHKTDSTDQSDDTNNSTENVPISQTLPIQRPIPIQQPSIVMRPAPFLQFVPVRPVHGRSPINIFIFNSRNGKASSQANQENTNKTSSKRQPHEKKKRVSKKRGIT